MIGEKKMPKKEIQHLSGDKADSKTMAKAKGQEMINVKWEKTPAWTIHSFSSNTTDDKKDYKLFTEEGNKGNDDYDTE
tara:strand:+ start:1368 stop:1601 length:234 start_codon:yes stop_codon:yes gene_type:complete